MVTDYGEIAVGTVAAAIGATPHRQTRLIERRRHSPSFQHRGIGQRDVRWGAVPLGGKAKRRVICPTDATAPIDKGVEHEIQKLVPELEADPLRASGGLA